MFHLYITFFRLHIYKLYLRDVNNNLANLS